MKKVWHDKDYTLNHEGLSWNLDIAEWRDQGRGELRVYRIEGDVTNSKLLEGLQILADSKGLQVI